MKYKMYRASWIITYITLQITKIITIIGAGILIISESDTLSLLQLASIKFGAIFFGFAILMILNRTTEAVEYYCHEYDI